LTCRFYYELLGFLFALTTVGALIYWLTARGWQLRHSFPDLREGQIDPAIFRLQAAWNRNSCAGQPSFS